MLNDPNRELLLQWVEGHPGVDGRFTDIRRLGRNGGDGYFSLMFSALDTRSCNRVVLKVFHPDRRTDTYRWESFRREAEILERLAGQPDIIGWVAPLSEFSVNVPVAPGNNFAFTFSYYAVELASHSLADAMYLEDWTADEKLRAFHCMCRAVQRMHSLKIAHRDLKPSNFLVMQNRDITLSDFGTARSLDGSAAGLLENYADSRWPGDTRYTPPEMLAGVHDQDPAIGYGADAYALGAILFELFAGAVLHSQVFDGDFARTFAMTMSAVPRTRRQEIFDQIAKDIASGHPLPSVASFGMAIPACIRDRVNSLYRSLAALDYRERRRNFSFQSVFHQIGSCRLILRNEAKYRRWLELRRRSRAVRRAQVSVPLITDEMRGVLR